MTLTINSDPEGAAISLNGVNTTAVTNHIFSDQPAGEYNITVVRAGYTSAPEYRAVNLTDGETKEVTFALTHEPVAAFTGTPTIGTAPLVVQFTDTSTNDPTLGTGPSATVQSQRIRTQSTPILMKAPTRSHLPQPMTREVTLKQSWDTSLPPFLHLKQISMSILLVAKLLSPCSSLTPLRALLTPGTGHLAMLL